MFLQMAGWIFLVGVALWSGGFAGLLFVFEGFLGSSNGVHWIFVVISIVFFILSYMFCPFALVVG